MRPPGHPSAHLTYCTNIHAGESWAEVRQNLEHHVAAVKRHVAPDEAFGIGLRLSGRAALELEEAPALAELRAFLAAGGMYVFTINGFPHGSFHGTRVKEEVYRPDWIEEERLEYSNRLARLLASLMPDDCDFDGSVSTVPVAFRPRAAGPDGVETLGGAVDRLLRHAAYLHDLERRTGRRIALALEPEPRCHLETTAEAVRFFEHCVYAPAARERFAALAGIAPQAAEAVLREHLGVCLDACHAAVEFENPAETVALLESAGIRIVKAQLSAGLAAQGVDAAAREELEAFDDGVYLHQVVERNGRTLTRYLDLADAVEAAEANDRAPDEWRIHFHVPLFRRTLGRFENTQPFLADLLAVWSRKPFTDHLEVETYTWDVLPAQYRNEAVADAVARELRWVLEALGP